MKNNESFEESPAPDEKSVREELEQVRRMILDTQANIVQVKADAMKDPSQAGALVHLKTILDSLREKEIQFNKQLEDLKGHN